LSVERHWSKKRSADSSAQGDDGFSWRGAGQALADSPPIVIVWFERSAAHGYRSQRLVEGDHATRDDLIPRQPTLEGHVCDPTRPQVFSSFKKFSQFLNNTHRLAGSRLNGRLAGLRIDWIDLRRRYE
jgi:hypothetical protein